MKKLLLLLVLPLLFSCSADKPRKQQISDAIVRVIKAEQAVEPIECLDDEKFIQWEILETDLDISPWDTPEGNKWYEAIGEEIAKECSKILSSKVNPMSQKRQNKGFRITKNKENIDVYMMERPEKKVAVVFSIHEN